MSGRFEYICPTCRPEKILQGWYNWKTHCSLYHEGADPRYPSSLNDSIRKAGGAEAKAAAELYPVDCPWPGCSQEFPNTDKLYNHFRYTHGVATPDRGITDSVVQADISEGFQNWLYLSDDYRKYCRDNGYPDPLDE